MRLTDEEVMRSLDALLRTRAISLHVLPIDPLPARDGEAISESPPPRVEARKRRTWIEIRLVGEDDLPISSARYLLKLPDGSEQEGYLDGRGLARIDDLDPGMCQVHFPDLDQDAWAPR